MGLFRLFLAMVVAHDHFRIIVLDPLGIYPSGWVVLGFNAGHAVMIFYAISGFLITFTLSKNYELNKKGLMKFYRNRFIRIFSLYWPIVAVAFVVLPWAWVAFTRANLTDQFTSLFLLGADWSVAFVAYPKQYFGGTVGGLPQVWTLGAELTFYLIAPFLLRSWKLAVLLLIISALTRAAFVAFLGSDLSHSAPWTYTFFPSTIVFFLLGHFSYRASQRYVSLNSGIIGTLLFASGMLVMAFGPKVGFDSPRFWISIMLLTASFPGLLQLTKDTRCFNIMGELSYPVYLVHILLAMIWLPLVAWLQVGGPHYAETMLVIFLSATLAVAAVTHFLIEKPASTVMHALATWPRRKRSVPSSPESARNPAAN